MTRGEVPSRDDDDDGAPPREAPHVRRWRQLLGLVGAAVVAAAVVAEATRPVAGSLGPVPDPSRWFDPAELQRSRAFRQPVQVLGLLGLALRAGVPAALLLTARGRRVLSLPALWFGDRRDALAAGAGAALVLVCVDLSLVPIRWWVGYVHEGRFGLRTQGLDGWLRDELVVRGPAWLLACAAGAIAWTVMRRLPRIWPQVLALVAAAATVVLVAVSPLVLEPLLLDVRPLPQGPTRTRIEEVLSRSHARIDALLVGDASRRTLRENAYISGLGGTRRVVVYDTLLAARSPDGVAAVVAHELGHDRHRDIERAALSGSAAAVVAVAVLSSAARRLPGRGLLAPARDPAIVAGLTALALLLTVAVQPAERWISRRSEAAADLAALDASGDPGAYAAMMGDLARANLGAAPPPAWARLLWSTHPPAASRILMAERWPHVSGLGADAATRAQDAAAPDDA